MSAYETIVHALAEVGMTTKGGTTRTRSQCPVHDSTGLTLSITAGEDRASVRCFAGCDDTDVLAAIGLGVGDLFDAPPAPGYRPPPRPSLSPWEQALADIGIHNGPPIEHLLHRMQVEAIKEGRASVGDDQ